jgi:hypothetical protein
LWKEGGREIMTENECKVKQTNKKTPAFEECQIAPGASHEKGHLTPEFKMANEIVCDHVGDKFHP